MTVLRDDIERAEGEGDDFRSLFNIHPTPMWVYDPDSFKFLIVNDAAIELYGYSRADYEQMTVLDIRPDYERVRFAEAIRSRSDIERAERWTHLKASGETFEVLTYGRIVRFEGMDAVLAIVQDRTEVSAAQRQVRYTRALLDSIVDNLPVGVFVKDMNDKGRYLLVNAASAEMMAIGSSQDIVGRVDPEIFTPEQTSMFADSDRRAIAGDQIILEETVRFLSGESRIVRTVKKALPEPDGRGARYMLGISQDVTEERNVEARFAYMALHDALTGLPNRAAFAEHIQHAARLASDDAPVALVFVDIDHFKEINDSRGHAAGDALLCEVANRLRAAMGPGDLVARLGGDEFAMVRRIGVAEVPDQFLQSLLDRLCRPFTYDGELEPISCSIGMAVAPIHGGSEDELSRNADLALYAAKEGGRSTFRAYVPSMWAAAERRRLMVSELREALAGDQFELHYQPITKLATGEISGFEALIRWHHPDHGMVSPGEFIPTAEDTGLIISIGEWSLRMACRTAATWPTHMTVAVNLSVCQFRDPQLLAKIVSALDESGLAPHRLEIEVTESVFLDDVEQSLPLLKAMKQLGIKISIDDFGTGYCSLGYLRAFQFDKIKLDRSFVSGIETDKGNLAIIRAVVGIGSGFNAITLAEGIETEAQLARLVAEGLHQGQGYLLGRPMPAAAVARLIGIEQPMARRVRAG